MKERATLGARNRLIEVTWECPVPSPERELPQRGRSWVWGAGWLVLGLTACGGAPTGPVQTAPTSAAAPMSASREPRSKVAVTTELGEIDRAATDRVLQDLQGAWTACYKAGLSRVEYLGGDIQFFFRVGTDGTLRWAFAEQSTLGDRGTESCMLEAARRVKWPLPQGGEAEVRKKIGFDPPSDVRIPTVWPPDRIASVMGKDGHRIESCKGGLKGKFSLTVYVEPDGGSGKVQAVGVAPPDKDGEEKAECILGVVKGWRMPSPGSYAAKVTFSL